MVKGIIFDMDGMIAHGKKFSVRLEEEYGIKTATTSEFFETDFQKCLIGKADLKEELGKWTQRWGCGRTIEELLDFWFDPQNSEIDLRFEPIIKQLRKRNIYCCLATNNEKYRTENLIGARDIGNWFDEIFASCDVGYKKPEREFFESISKKSGIETKRLQFWDDDVQNVEAAAALGLDAKTYLNFEDFLKHANL